MFKSFCYSHSSVIAADHRKKKETAKNISAINYKNILSSKNVVIYTGALWIEVNSAQKKCRDSQPSYPYISVTLVKHRKTGTKKQKTRTHMDTFHVVYVHMYMKKQPVAFDIFT